MCGRWLILFCTLGWLVLPVVVDGQTSEEEEMDAIQGDGVRLVEDDTSSDLADVARLIVHRTNEFRQDEGRQNVIVDPALREAARYFANFMARTDIYGHTADGDHPAERAEQHGYEYCIISENIATAYSSVGFTTEQLVRQFVRGWKQSPGHRQNMLAPAVTDTGVTVARSEKTGYYYAVQMFGRPRSERISFQIANRAGAVLEYTIGERTFPLPPRATRTHQRCRPAELTFQWPDTPESTTVQPTNGAQYTLTQENSGEFNVTRE